MKILVPIDFLPVTENALRFAIDLSKTMQGEVTLFHVISSEKEKNEKENQLKELIEKYKSSGIALDFLVQTGNIFDHIGEAAITVNASLIVMGTHGVKGMQKIIGSRAMKVITNSQTPYIVVQHKAYRPLKNILMPVDYTKEIKQVYPTLATLAKTFDATIYLQRQQNKDEFLRNKITYNMQYFRATLEDDNFKLKVLDNEFSSGKYKDIIKEAAAIDADLIVTLIDPETDISDYIMGVEEQKIVANEQEIPVLCINMKNFRSKSGSVFDYTA